MRAHDGYSGRLFLRGGRRRISSPVEGGELSSPGCALCWAGRTVSRGRAVQLELPEQISLLTQLLSTKRGGVETEPGCFLGTGVSLPWLSNQCSEGCGGKSEGGLCVSMRRESDFPIAQHSCLFQPLLSSWGSKPFSITLRTNMIIVKSY